MEVRNTFATPLTIDQLFIWHTLLMADAKGIAIGRFRTHAEPMQVVSGAIGKEKVHFEAPPSAQVYGEMERFIDWFNESAPDGSTFIPSGPVRAAIAHLYFESIHPFEDGNGRIGRAIADKVLSQHLGRPVMFSLSSTIEAKKEAYYNALENAQRENEISAWMMYFISTILEAQDAATRQIEFTLRKTRFFDQHREAINDRQRKALHRMFEAGPEGFEGGMNARKYISITAASKATATRDLQDLMEKGIFVQREGGGRSTSYDVVF
jgi:Fic family protein